jgi:hypothetical protein
MEDSRGPGDEGTGNQRALTHQGSGSRFTRVLEIVFGLGSFSALSEDGSINQFSNSRDHAHR